MSTLAWAIYGDIWAEEPQVARISLESSILQEPYRSKYSLRVVGSILKLSTEQFSSANRRTAVAYLSDPAISEPLNVTHF
jgi:hypothetical protein